MAARFTVLKYGEGPADRRRMPVWPGCDSPGRYRDGQVLTGWSFAAVYFINEEVCAMRERGMKRRGFRRFLMWSLWTMLVAAAGSGWYVVER